MTKFQRWRTDSSYSGVRERQREGGGCEYKEQRENPCDGTVLYPSSSGAPANGHMFRLHGTKHRDTKTTKTHTQLSLCKTGEI